MKKIAIFQSDLRVGGIQKALVNILSELDSAEYAIDLYLFDADEGEEFFALPERENLRVIRLKAYPFLSRLVYFGLLRRFVPVAVRDEDYDVAVDFSSYRMECAVGAAVARAKKRIMWIHNDVEIKKRNEFKYRVLWHFFKGKLRCYDAFCAVSPGIIDGFRRVSGITDKPIYSIPNHIDTAEIFAKMDEPIDFSPAPENFNLCTMGRLCHQKGFDILLDHFSRAAREREDLHLYILGDGPDREKLTAQISRLGLEKRVTLLGNQSNPFPYLKKMDGFTLTSRYEGQGLVIWEAKAVGLPLFIADNLEKYNPGIPGIALEELPDAFVAAKKGEKTPDALTDYNAAIGATLREVLQ